MHDDHDHHGHPHDHHHHEHGHGHNGPAGRPVQWQTPHLPHDHARPAEDAATADLDLVETAFLEGFSRAPDVTSFLRLAGIPFVGETKDGRRLHLLRVETDEIADVGAVMPLVGGAGVAYQPLPAKLTSRRRRLGFLYHDGIEPRRLGFAEARGLADRSQASQFSIRPPGTR